MFDGEWERWCLAPLPPESFVEFLQLEAKMVPDATNPIRNEYNAADQLVVPFNTK
jgi:hypothetical protein